MSNINNYEKFKKFNNYEDFKNFLKTSNMISDIISLMKSKEKLSNEKKQTWGEILQILSTNILSKPFKISKVFDEFFKDLKEFKNSDLDKSYSGNIFLDFEKYSSQNDSDVKIKNFNDTLFKLINYEYQELNKKDSDNLSDFDDLIVLFEGIKYEIQAIFSELFYDIELVKTNPMIVSHFLSFIMFTKKKLIIKIIEQLQDKEKDLNVAQFVFSFFNYILTFCFDKMVNFKLTDNKDSQLDEKEWEEAQDLMLRSVIYTFLHFYSNISPKESIKKAFIENFLSFEKNSFFHQFYENCFSFFANKQLPKIWKGNFDYFEFQDSDVFEKIKTIKEQNDENYKFYFHKYRNSVSDFKNCFSAKKLKKLIKEIEFNEFKSSNVFYSRENINCFKKIDNILTLQKYSGLGKIGSLKEYVKENTTKEEFNVFIDIFDTLKNKNYLKETENEESEDLLLSFQNGFNLLNSFIENKKCIEKNKDLLDSLKEKEDFILERDLPLHFLEVLQDYQDPIKKLLLNMSDTGALFFVNILEWITEADGTVTQMFRDCIPNPDENIVKWQKYIENLKSNPFKEKANIFHNFLLFLSFLSEKRLFLTYEIEIKNLFKIFSNYFHIPSSDKDLDEFLSNFYGDIDAETMLPIVQSIRSINNLINYDYDINLIFFEFILNDDYKDVSISNYIKSFTKKDIVDLNNFLFEEKYAVLKEDGKSNDEAIKELASEGYKKIKNIHFNIKDDLKIFRTVEKINKQIERSDGYIKDFIKDFFEQKFIKKFYLLGEKQIKDLEKLKEECPNFISVVEYYQAQILLNKDPQPVLLLGSSGVGKTSFINKISNVLGTNCEFINCPLINSSLTLCGSDFKYDKSSTGSIYNTFFDTENAQPIFVFDEIDKTDSKGGDGILNVLISLLEKTTASKYKDNYNNCEMDFSTGIYVLSANNIEDLKPALLSRLEIFDIEMPEKEFLEKIIDKIWSGFNFPNEKLELNVEEEKSFKYKHLLNGLNFRNINAVLNKVANRKVLGEEVTEDLVYNIIKLERETSLKMDKSFYSLLDPKDIKENFDEIQGIDEAKDQLKTMIDLFKKDNQDFLQFGLKKPKGFILYGAPGVGKTMIAKSFAKEVNMPFISLSGSSFVQEFVGTGAKRVRNLFKKARENKPCIIFIDEIDALGSRTAKGNDSERQSTINEFLTQLDGANNNDGIFVIGATNFLDKLDEALVRAGRFDRKIEIPLPSFNSRKNIIKQIALKMINEAKKNNNDETKGKFDYLFGDEKAFNELIDQLTKITSNLSPADIQGLFNQTVVNLLKRNTENEINGKEKIFLITLDDFLLANEDLFLGIKTLKETDENRKITAYHEVGHAVLGSLLKHCDPVSRVTITPRANSLGVTYSYSESDKTNISKDALLDKICMTLGGRAAEEIFTNQISTGASSDIKTVSRIANSMVKKYGLADDDYLSMVLYNEDEMNTLSERTKERIEAEVIKIIKNQYNRAKDILTNNKTLVEKMTQILFEKEVINEIDIKNIFKELNIDFNSI